MTARVDYAEPEEPELFRIRRPSRTQLAIFGIAMVEAAQVAGIAPHGPATAISLAAGAFTFLVRGCVYRHR